jgi:hypothetical protein
MYAAGVSLPPPSAPRSLAICIAPSRRPMPSVAGVGARVSPITAFAIQFSTVISNGSRGSLIGRRWFAAFASSVCGTVTTRSNAGSAGSMIASSARRTSSMKELLCPSSIDIIPSSEKAPVTSSPTSSRIRPACSTTTPIRRRDALNRATCAATRFTSISTTIVDPPGSGMRTRLAQ